MNFGSKGLTVDSGLRVILGRGVSSFGSGATRDISGLVTRGVSGLVTRDDSALIT